MADETIFDQVSDNPTEIDPNAPLTLEIDPQYKEYLEKYVGEGKKYANAGELVKAYANADTHIVDLKSDLARERSEKLSLKDLLMDNLLEEPKTPEIKDQGTPTGATPETPVEQTPPTKTQEGNPLSDVDISKLVEDALEKKEAERRRRTNADTVEQAMITHFGTKEDAIKAVQDRAVSLGIPAQQLVNMAFDAPAAYYELMGIKPNETPRSNNTPAPRSEINPQRLADANPRAKEGSYRFYEEMRRTNPNKFRSQEIQAQMMKDAETNPNFYS